jgi:hypothetical protein
MLVETPDVVDEAFAGDPVIFVGLHSGPSNCPASAGEPVGGAVAPMETIADPGLQDWFVRLRAMGIRIVDRARPGRELLAALREGTSVARGRPRPTGGGKLTELRRPRPCSDPMLAVESGAAPYVGMTDGRRRYRGRLERVEVPAEVPARLRRRRRPTSPSPSSGSSRTPRTVVGRVPIWPDLEVEVRRPAEREP